MLGVAGGELLIPTLILLFGVDVKLAGSLSLAVSLPTMLVGFARYSLDSTFAVLRRNGRFAVAMGIGSVVGSFIGAKLLSIVPGSILPPILALILLVSSVKLWLPEGPKAAQRPNNATQSTSFIWQVKQLFRHRPLVLLR